MISEGLVSERHRRYETGCREGARSNTVDWALKFDLAVLRHQRYWGGKISDAYISQHTLDCRYSNCETSHFSRCRSVFGAEKRSLKNLVSPFESESRLSCGSRWRKSVTVNTLMLIGRLHNHLFGVASSAMVLRRRRQRQNIQARQYLFATAPTAKGQGLVAQPAQQCVSGSGCPASLALSSNAF